MSDTNGTFLDALKIPAIIAMVGNDAGDSLRVLHSYALRCQETNKRPPLSDLEAAALQDILEIVVQQSLNAVVFYIFAYCAIQAGGVFAGQAAQVLISINAMTAPKSQFVKPHEWLGMRDAGDAPALWARLLGAIGPQVAFALGKLAEMTGCHDPHRQDRTCPERFVTISREKRASRRRGPASRFHVVVA
jgi:hypothetical protein